jgi:hypothetical protein
MQKSAVLLFRNDPLKMIFSFDKTVMLASRKMWWWEKIRDADPWPKFRFNPMLLEAGCQCRMCQFIKLEEIFLLT